VTITEFLLARIAEDEAVAREVLAQQQHDVTRSPGDFPSGYDPAKDAELASADGPIGYTVVMVGVARVLAECEAKRRIVELHQSWPVLVETPPNLEVVTPDDLSTIAVRASKRLAWLTEQEYRARFGTEPPTAPMLRALASVYADHPDFDPAWRVHD